MEREKPARRSNELGEWLPPVKVRKLEYEASVLLARFCNQVACQHRTVPRVQETARALDSAVEAAQQPRCAAPILFRPHLAV
jgi:hypothetical protein